MPRAPRPCIECRQEPAVNGARCQHCTTQARRPRDRQRLTSHQRGYTRRWRATRHTYLTTHPWCECDGCPKCIPTGGPCQLAATDVDHIDGLGPKGPRGHDPDNLRALSHACHSHRTARDQPGGWNQHTPMAIPTTYVTGPPCSGKTTWVHAHAQAGDLTLDWDRLMAALTPPAPHGHTRHQRLIAPTAVARDALTQWLHRPTGQHLPPRAWVITTRPPRELQPLTTQPHVTLHIMDTPKTECLRRLHSDRDGRNVTETEQAIKAWPA